MLLHGKQIRNASVQPAKFDTAGYVPSQENDLATVKHVSALLGGLKPKAGVKVAATGNIDRTVAITEIDGYTLQDGDRVLLWQQTSALQNGVYVYNAATQLLNTRAADFDDAPSNEVGIGTYVFVDEGLTYGGFGFFVSGSDSTDPDDLTVDTHTIEFSIHSRTTSYTGGSGISINGGDINFDGTVVGDGLLWDDVAKLINVDGATLAGAGIGWDGTKFTADLTTIAGSGLNDNAGAIDLGGALTGNAIFSGAFNVKFGEENAEIAEFHVETTGGVYLTDTSAGVFLNGPGIYLDTTQGLYATVENGYFATVNTGDYSVQVNAGDLRIFNDKGGVLTRQVGVSDFAVDLYAQGTHELHLNTATGALKIYNSSIGLTLTAEGLSYDADYTPNWTSAAAFDNVLVSKKYVDDAVGASGSVLAGNGLTANGTSGAIDLGGTLDADVFFPGNGGGVYFGYAAEGSPQAIGGFYVSTGTAIFEDMSEFKVTLSQFDNSLLIHSANNAIEFENFDEGWDRLNLVSGLQVVIGISDAVKSQGQTGSGVGSKMTFGDAYGSDDIIVTLNGTGVFAYATDYSNNYTDRSLVDRGYVLGLLGTNGIESTPLTVNRGEVVATASAGADNHDTGIVLAQKPKGLLLVTLNGQVMSVATSAADAANHAFYFADPSTDAAKDFSALVGGEKLMFNESQATYAIDTEDIIDIYYL